MIMPLRVYIFSLFFLTFLYVAFPKSAEASTLYNQSLPSSVITASIEATQDMTYPITVAGTDSPQNLFLRIENIGNHTIVNPKITVDGKDWSTIDTILANILSPGMTKEEQAWAIWQFGRENYYHWWPASISYEIHDPVKLFNSYGYGFCDDIASVLAALFEHVGIPSRIWSIGANGEHTVSEAYYNGDWHMFDVDRDGVYLKQDNQTVAGVWDLISTPSLVQRAGPAHTDLVSLYAATRPNQYFASYWGYSVTRHQIQLNLRPQESISYFWDEQDTYVQDTPWNVFIPPVYANAQLVSQLSPRNSWYRETILGESNIRSYSDDGMLPALRPATTSNEGNITYTVSSPFPIVSALFNAKLFRRSVSDTITIYASVTPEDIELSSNDFVSYQYRIPGLFQFESNIANYSEDQGYPTIHSSSVGKPSNLTYQLQHYPNKPFTLNGDFYRGSSSDNVMIDISYDNINWQPIWKASDSQIGYFTKNIDLAKVVVSDTDFYIRVAFIAAKSKWSAGIMGLRFEGIAPRNFQPVWSTNQISETGDLEATVDLSHSLNQSGLHAKYSYAVRIGMTAISDTFFVGLDSMVLTTNVQIAPRSLPALKLNTNTILYTTQSEQQSSALITHGWIPAKGVHSPFPPDISSSQTQIIDAKSPFRLTWGNAIDPDNDAITLYHIQICYRSDCRWPLSSIFDTNVDDTSWLIPFNDWFNPGQTYYWRVKALDSTGRWSEYSTIQSFNVVEEPIAGLLMEVPQLGISGQPVVMSGTITSSSNVQFNWEFGDGSRGNGANATHTYELAGRYTITLTAINPLSIVTATTNIEIEEPIAGLLMKVPQLGISGQPVVMSSTITSGSNVQFNWEFGDGSRGSGVNTTHTYGLAGRYTITLTVINPISIVTSTTNIEIEEPISGLLMKVPQLGIIGQPVAMSGTITSGSDVQFNWEFGDGSRGSGTVVDHIYRSTGVYTISLTIWNQLSILTDTMVIQIEPLTLAVTVTAPVSAEINVPIQMEAKIAEASELHYTWDFGDGDIATGSVVEHTYQIPGEFEVQVLATSTDFRGTAVHNLQIIGAERNPVEQEVIYTIWLPIISK